MRCLHQRKHTASSDLVNSITQCKKQFMQLTRACSVFQNWCWLRSPLQTGSPKTLSIIFRTDHYFFKSATISDSFIGWINISWKTELLQHERLKVSYWTNLLLRGQDIFLINRRAKNEPLLWIRRMEFDLSQPGHVLWVARMRAITCR